MPAVEEVSLKKENVDAQSYRSLPVL
jgi:hypothetical protein